MKTKAVIFDFDGTLTKPHKLPNSWARVWSKIDCLDEDEKYYSQFRNGEITYREWLYLCYECYKRENVCAKLFEDVAEEIELVDYIEEFFKTLYDSNIKIYILSGGVGNIIDSKLAGLKKYITSIEADTFLLDEAGKLCGVKESPSRLETKSYFVKSLLKDLNLNENEVVFVGNGCNDEEVYKAKVKTICVNPDKNAHPDNRTFWTYDMSDCKDIREILKFII